MCPFAIIGGTNLFHSRVFRDMEQSKVSTEHGTVEMFRSKDRELLFIPRHGLEDPLPPHRVNHHANILALRSEGVKNLLGITSVGSLKKEVTPGTLMIPEDYMQLTGIKTFFHDRAKHITPTLCQELREEIKRIGTEHGFPVRSGGVYIQTTGPRFETRAEIRFFSQFGDLIGMNMATEATLARELDMEYANLSVVDNYGNGISGEITYDEFMEMVKAHQKKLDEFLEILIPGLQKTFK